MCGIVGYVGASPAYSILIDGLKRLEYRGYDSAGVAVINEGRFAIARAKGKIKVLEDLLEKTPLPGTIGIGHTRWATHGRPSEINAHPHRAGRAVVVHNGIIENYLALKRSLIESGRTFSSETDTEVIAQLIDHHLQEGMEPLAAIARTCRELHGSFAAGILIEDEPETFFAIRKESPLIVGVSDGESLIASDIPAILGHTRRMIFMEDGEIAVLKAGSVFFTDFD